MKARTVALAVIVLLAAAYAGATWHNSSKAEAAALEWTQKLVKAAPFLRASTAYQRGFLHSTQDVTLQFASTPASGKTPSVTIRNVIHHGPLPGLTGVGHARIEHSLVFDDETAKEVAKAFGDAAPISAVTRVDFPGDGVTEVKGAPASFTQGGGSLAWKGLSGTLRFTRGLETYGGDLAVPGATATGKDGNQAVLGAIAVKLDQRRMPGTESVYLGTMGMRVESIAVGKGGKTEFELKGISFAADSTTPEPEFIDMTGRFAADAFASPVFSGTDLVYAFSARHLHGPSLDALGKAMQEARSAAGQDPAAAQTAFLKVLGTHGLALLQRDPVVAIERIGFVGQGGETRLSATARLVGVTQADMANPMGLIAKVQADATIKASEAMLAATMVEGPLRAMRAQGREPTAEEVAQLSARLRAVYEQKVAELVEKGYAVREAGGLSAKASFRNGELTVNGKPFSTGQ